MRRLDPIDKTSFENATNEHFDIIHVLIHLFPLTPVPKFSPNS